jgi:hypothetical protein
VFHFSVAETRMMRNVLLQSLSCSGPRELAAGIAQNGSMQDGYIEDIRFSFPSLGWKHSIVAVDDATAMKVASLIPLLRLKPPRL